MRAIIQDNQWIYMDNVSTNDDDILWHEFSVARPGCFIDPNQRGQWDGIYRKYNKYRQRLARPYLAKLRQICDKHQLPLVIVDNRPEWPYAIKNSDEINNDFLPGITLEEYQVDCIRTITVVECGIIDIPTAGGKCFAEGTLVLMYDGSTKPVEQIETGDLIMGDDSTHRCVLSTHCGESELYRVHQKNGDDYFVNSNHILSLIRTPDGKSKLKDYQKVDISIRDYLDSSKTRKHILKGYKAAIDFKHCQKPLCDPYLLGVWLGDGLSRDLQFCLNHTTDGPIVEYLNEYCQNNGYTLVRYQHHGGSSLYAIRLYAGVHRPNSIAPFAFNQLKQTFLTYDLFNNKHIPHSIKCGSRDTRLACLAGLIDSDGYTNERKDMLYITLKQGRLADDIIFLARSLGYRVTSNLTRKGNGNGFFGFYRRITISGLLHTIPVKLPHKRCRLRIKKSNPLVYGITVSKGSCGRYYGFEIDGNKRFLLADLTVAHNSELIAGTCKAIDCPTVILADQRVVIDQLKARLELRDVTDDVGVFYAGKRPNGQWIVVGSIQSVTMPKKTPEMPKRTAADTDANYAKKLSRWDISFKAFKTRKKNVKTLIELIKRAQMLIVDEADKAVSDPWKNLFKHYFSGRRRYGFCLAGDTKLCTPSGQERIDSFKDGEIVTVLSSNGLCDTWERGMVVTAGQKQLYTTIFNDGSSLRSSGDHLVADDRLGYIRVKDITPGQTVKALDDAFIDNLEDLTELCRQFDASGDLSSVSWQGFELTRADFYQQVVNHEVNNILSNPTITIGDAGLLACESYPITVHKSHESEFVRGGEVQQFSAHREIVAIIEFGWEFETPTTVTFGQCLADLASHVAVVNRIPAEFLSQTSQVFGDLVWSQEDNWHTVTLHHGLIDSSLQFAGFHRMVNTISLEAGLSPSLLVIERFTTVSVEIDSPRFLLMCRDGKPIFYAMLCKHFLFASFVGGAASGDYMRQLVDAGRTQMTTKLFNLIRWTINRTCINHRTAIALHRDDIVVSGSALIPFSFDDHRLSLSKRVPVYLCQKLVKVVSVISGPMVPMFDVIDVTRNANFYVNNGLLVHNSGTPFDSAKPVEGMVMQEHLGSVIFKESREHLLTLGRITPCDYHMLAFGLDGDIHEASTYDAAFNDHVVHNPKFHQLVANLCRISSVDGTGVLILVDREPLGHSLKKVISELGLPCEFIYGKTRGRNRDEALRAFERRELKVLIGGKIINRGLDLKGGCETLINATSLKLRSDLLQKMGRAFRLNRLGKGRVYDMFFRCNKHLYGHSKTKLKVVVNEGIPARVIFPGGSIDGAELVRRRFSIRNDLLIRRHSGSSTTTENVLHQ